MPLFSILVSSIKTFLKHMPPVAPLYHLWAAARLHLSTDFCDCSHGALKNSHNFSQSNIVIRPFLIRINPCWAKAFNCLETVSLFNPRRSARYVILKFKVIVVPPGPVTPKSFDSFQSLAATRLSPRNAVEVFFSCRYVRLTFMDSESKTPFVKKKSCSQIASAS